jgi:hypothetical protein
MPPPLALDIVATLKQETALPLPAPYPFSPPFLYLLVILYEGKLNPIHLFQSFNIPYIPCLGYKN